MFALLGGYCHFKCCSFDGPANENVVHFGLFSFVLPGSPSCNSTQISIHTHTDTLNILRSYWPTNQPTNRPNKTNVQTNIERMNETKKKKKKKWTSKLASERVNVARLKSLTSLCATFLLRAAFYFFFFLSFIRSCSLVRTPMLFSNSLFHAFTDTSNMFRMQFLISG